MVKRLLVIALFFVAPLLMGPAPMYDADSVIRIANAAAGGTAAGTNPKLGNSYMLTVSDEDAVCRWAATCSTSNGIRFKVGNSYRVRAGGNAFCCASTGATADVEIVPSDI